MASAIILMLGITTACEAGENVTFVNLTNMVVEVRFEFNGNTRTPTLDPRERRELGSFGLGEGQTIDIEARADGKLIYQESLTFSELKSRDFVVSIHAQQ